MRCRLYRRTRQGEPSIHHSGVLAVADDCRTTTRTRVLLTYFFLAAFLAFFLVAFFAFFFVAMVHSFRLLVKENGDFKCPRYCACRGEKPA